MNQAFSEFHHAINIKDDQRDTSRARRDSIVNYLKEDFHILEAFPSGSITKYTGLRGFADLDVMVALNYGRHCKNKLPSEVLQQVRDVLSHYKTGAKKNGQAVTLYYSTWPDVDIVPAFRTVGENKAVIHYNIPDMNTETWIRSNPKIHSAILKERASTYGSEFRQIIKMVKWWNRQHSSYLQSYHIEVLALISLTGRFSNFSFELWRFFDHACKSLEATLAGAPLQYFEGCVDEYLSYSDLLEAYKRLEIARDTLLSAHLAITFCSTPNHQLAIELSRQVFGDKFPAF